MARSCARDINSFKVEAGVHQESMLSPLLFVIVIYTVSRTSGEKVPLEVLYDLVLMADSYKEELTRKLTK